jgi:Trypsin-co-occurring domain 1
MTVDVYVEGAKAKTSNDLKAFNRVDDVVDKAMIPFSETMDVVQRIAAEAEQKLTQSASRPTEVTLEFGLTVGGEAGNVVFGKISAEGTFKVSMTWKK